MQAFAFTGSYNKKKCFNGVVIFFNFFFFVFLFPNDDYKKHPQGWPGCPPKGEARPVSAEGGLDGLEMLLLRNRAVEFAK